MGLPFEKELVVDLFAGGGASTGIARAYREPDVTLNHSPIALAVHRANHSQTTHYVADVLEGDPVHGTGGQPVRSKEWVFRYNGNAMHRINDSAWKKARARAGKIWQEKYLRPALPGFVSIRVHDLKHTFGRRLRAAGVTLEDRKALLGHKNGSITSHYSTAELGQLIEAANKASTTDSRGPALTIFRRKTG
jgi:integrase